MSETETHQKNSSNSHTCKVQMSGHSEKTMSFNVDLNKLLLEDAHCIPSQKRRIIPFSDVTILLHTSFSSAP